MDVSITVNGLERVITVPEDADESAFWQVVSCGLIDPPIPADVTVSCPLGTARLEIAQRGSRIVAGRELPTPVFNAVENGIMLPPSTYSEAYLTCVNPESKGQKGEYKFYRFIPRADGIHAEWGRIGGRVNTLRTPYPSWMFWPKYFEKIAKGYEDRSTVYLRPSATSEPAPEDDAVSASGVDSILFTRLLSLAKRRIRRTLIDENVTEEQVGESEALLAELRAQGDVRRFNAVLLRLMAIAPRRTDRVSWFLAGHDSEFGSIIDREEDLVSAMRTVVEARKPVSGSGMGFAALGIGVRLATDEEIARDIRPNLSGRLNAKIRAVYAVSPAAQRARFEARCASRGIAADGIRLLWHGSRNENWCSIVEKSLLLNPDAQRTGSMFGNGLYFSLEGRDGRGEKSWGYTSYRGTWWASGDADIAFMGLYDCAYGKPMMVTTTGWHSQSELTSMDCDCVHALAGRGFLQNDEIVFYTEDAVCLRYLVEFA